MGATACGFATDGVEARDGKERGLVQLEPVGGCIGATGGCIGATGGCIGATGCGGGGGGAMHAVALELQLELELEVELLPVTCAVGSPKPLSMLPPTSILQNPNYRLTRCLHARL